MTTLIRGSGEKKKAQEGTFSAKYLVSGKKENVRKVVSFKIVFFLGTCVEL